MKSKFYGTKPTSGKDFEKLQFLFASYYHNKSENVSDLFFTFLTDKMLEVQEFLYNTGYKDIFLNKNGMFLKKGDIFRSVCIDKIFNNILQKHEGNVYIEIEKNIFLGAENYHSPDISVYNGFNEENFDDYYDTYLSNPEPTAIIEFVDLGDESYLRNIVLIYQTASLIYPNTAILFVDLVRKDLFKFVNINCSEMIELTPICKNDLGPFIINNHLQKLDFYNDLRFNDLIINFEKILASKEK
ncbi:hypothetical protein GVAV_000503 [Gurleya vavrai]